MSVYPYRYQEGSDNKGHATSVKANTTIGAHQRYFGLLSDDVFFFKKTMKSFVYDGIEYVDHSNGGVVI